MTTTTWIMAAGAAWVAVCVLSLAFLRGAGPEKRSDR